MFNSKHNKYKNRAEILMSGQSLSFKLDESETIKLVENLEEVSYDFKKLDSISTSYFTYCFFIIFFLTKAVSREILKHYDICFDKSLDLLMNQGLGSYINKND